MTSIETGPSWAERLNPRHWTLVWKLVIVGLVPALLALTLGVLRITDQAGSAADLSRGAQLLQLHTQVSTAGDGLRQERDQATLYVASNRNGDRGAITAADAHTDETIAAMRAAVTGAGTLDQSTSVAVAQADGLLGQLTDLRRDVTDNTVALPTIRDRYTRVIEGVDVLSRAVLRAVRVPDTAGQVDALTALQNVEAQLAVQHTVLGDAIRAGSLQNGDPAAATNADLLIFAQYRAYQVALTPDQLQRYGSFLDDSSNADRQRLAATILKPDLASVSAASWDAAYTASKSVADRSAESIRQDLVAASNAAAQRAGNLAGINSVVLLLGLLIGITIAVLVSRSLIRSLRVLRGAALDVAERRLPHAVESMRAGEAPDVAVEPVPIRSRDEVGQVARAFDAVHGQAVRLAAEQAALQTNVSAMFVNLSRRSQALVERQLQLIEALESNEQDSDQLHNLFQLDHLATRMRRNSENLLVLAGTDLAKRNVAPVPMVDVLRAAVSEVEQYQRVVVQAPPAASVVGRAGSDLVHLLAELLDNATNFSPPDSQVVMSATRTPDGAMVVEISDRGVGMADQDLGDANERLGGPTDVDVSASRRMGLFVVGRLAARHGIAVRLSSAAAGPGSGLTAWVTVPGSLIPTGMPVEPARSLPIAAGAGDRGQRPEINGARSGALSALATGPGGPEGATGAPAAAADADAQSTLFAGRPPVNGTTANGLPTRKPGSSLRPEGPPPTSAPPGGFFDDGSVRGPDRDRQRAPGEQARLDQEAAARRDRLAEVTDSATDAPTTDRRPPASDDERPLSGDERSSRGEGGTPDDTGARLSRDGADPRPEPFAERPFGTTAEGTGEPAADGLRPPPGRGHPPVGPEGPAGGGPLRGPGAEPRRPEFGAPDDRPRPPGAPFGPGRMPGPGPEPANTGGPRVAGPAGPRSFTDGNPPSDERVGGSTAFRPPPAVPSGEPVRSGGAPLDDDPTTPPGAEPAVGPPSYPGLPQRRPGRAEPRLPAAPAGGPPRAEWANPAPSTPQEDTDSSRPFRTDQQHRDTPPASPAGWSVPDADPLATPAPSGRPTGRSQDELFAPRVPSLDPDGVLPGHDPGASAFDMGETTPIFEEIASAWFRSNRPVPVSWESETGPQPITEEAPPQKVEAVDDTGRTRDTAADRPASVPSAGWSIPEPAAAVEAAPLGERSDLPQRVPAARASLDAALGGDTAAPAAEAPADFATAADEGWLAASTATERSDELTSAGLPKRRPRARLIPGSAGSAVLAPAVTAARSAETIRGRLASYQQGVRQGRETRLRGLESAEDPAPPATADADHDEESS